MEEGGPREATEMSLYFQTVSVSAEDKVAMSSRDNSVYGNDMYIYSL